MKKNNKLLTVLTVMCCLTAYSCENIKNIEINTDFDVEAFATKLSLRAHIRNKLHNLDEKHKWIKSDKYLDSLFNVIVEGISIAGRKDIEKNKGIIVFYNTNYKTYSNANLNCWLLYNFIDINKNICKNSQKSIDEVASLINKIYSDVDLSKAVSDIKAYNEALGLDEWIETADKHKDIDVIGGIDYEGDLSFRTSYIHAKGKPGEAIRLIYNFKREGKKFKFKDVECCRLCNFKYAECSNNDVLEEVLSINSLNNYLEYDANTTDVKRYHLDLMHLYKSEVNKCNKVLSIVKEKTNEKTNSTLQLNTESLYENVFRKYPAIKWKKELTLVIPSVIDKNEINYFKATNDNVRLNEYHLYINPQFINSDLKFHIREKGNVYDFQDLDPTSIDLRGMRFVDGVDLNHFFGSLYNLKTIIGLNDALKGVKNVKDIANMFAGCRSLEEININADFELQSHDYSYMFYDCKKLKTINIPNIKHNGKEDSINVNCVIAYDDNLETVKLWQFIKDNKDKLPKKLQDLM